MSIETARTVADAVLYEGYLLYPYRSTSSKNQSRWQFGVIGPPGAAAAGMGEDDRLAVQCVLCPSPPLNGSGSGSAPAVSVHLRFLQLQARVPEQALPDPSGGVRFEPVSQLTVGDRQVVSWDEAVEHELTLPLQTVAGLTSGCSVPVAIEGGEEVEPLHDGAGLLVGRVVRRRWALAAEVLLQVDQLDGYLRLGVQVRNGGARPGTKQEAIRTSMIGAHLLIEAVGTDFVSLLEPPDAAAATVAQCQQHRCWPVLTGPPGSTDVVLASPIILYDYPAVAEQSVGALFDATEIDEILTLRVMTMTEQEKAEARATDPRAAEIIDRCDAMTPADLQQLHGILRDPYADRVVAPTDPPDEIPVRSHRAGAAPGGPPPEFAEALATIAADADQPWFASDVPWWDPAADERVQPEVDAVLIDGVSVSKGSLVRVHPSRRADAQDMFFADQVARVTAVLSDVDGGVHVAVVLVDDPAMELHDWYGRYLYFAPDELQPLPGPPLESLDQQRKDRS